MSPENAIRLEHFYAHAPASVWRAITDPELHAQWWAPGDIRAEEGHTFELDMGPWGKQPCEVLEVQHERLLRYRFGTGTLDTIITFELTAEAGGTRLRFTQEGFDLASPLGRSALDGMKSGWPGVLEGLGKLLDRTASA